MSQRKYITSSEADVDPLSANPTKWSDLLKPTNFLSAFNHFVELKELTSTLLTCCHEYFRKTHKKIYAM